ncbi:hypothetical protein NX722_19280 [Endozoicomonas gorgoniicola]|uniref:RING-type E3 ubiquitin transferase n=1 Tax=Endozoicomonas gorgoniicola TaxID=1234144 RepID=A0ABT3MZB2_9GAMM|nr:RING finger domain-containing protein [Endozoicomonas gorgoniicola]MCW7554719.1 hypothetical protein [Endozoicomonas gorgoniicola]
MKLLKTFAIIIFLSANTNLFFINNVWADSHFFSTYIHSRDLTGSLKLFNKATHSDEFEVLASPGQQILVCGHSIVQNGAVPLTSSNDGVTTYQLTHETAQFYYYGSKSPCAANLVFKQQPVHSASTFLIKWREKNTNKPGKTETGSTLIVPANPTAHTAADTINGYGSGGDTPGPEDFFKRGRPFFPTFFTESLFINIDLPFLKYFSLPRVNTTEDDYRYLDIFVRTPDTTEPVHIQLSRALFQRFLEDFSSSGHWNSLLAWIKSQAGSRSWLVNHLIHTLNYFSEVDDLWPANPEVLQAITTQLNDILENTGQPLQLELELEWLNLWLGKIEVPQTGQEGNQNHSPSGNSSDSSATSTTSSLQASTSLTHTSGECSHTNGADGEAPFPSHAHTFNFTPCPACRGEPCQLKKPPENAEDKETLENWMRLVNTHSSRGVIIRVIKSLEFTAQTIQQNRASSGTFLFPGSVIAPFGNSEAATLGIVLHPDTITIARFKQNAITARVHQSLGFVASILNRGANSCDYNTLSSGSRRYHKNHINNFSFLLKLLEQHFLFTNESASPTAITSGSITREGGLRVGHKHYDRNRNGKTIPHNEVVFKWDNWSDKLLGFFLRSKDSTVQRDTLLSLKTLIRSLTDISIDNMKLAELPVALFCPEEARFIFVCTARQLFELELDDEHVTDFTIPEGVSHSRAFTSMELLNPDHFASNIDYIGRLLASCCSGNNLSFPAASFNNRDGICLTQALRVSCNRQLLEFAGLEFSTEEALLLSYLATLPEHLSINNQQVEALMTLFRASGASIQVVQDMALAITCLNSQPEATTTHFAQSEPGSRARTYYHLLQARNGDYTRLSETGIEAATVDLAQLETSQANIMHAIKRFKSTPAIRSTGHGWPIMLAELRLVIPAITVERLRKNLHPIQQWPYAEIMASIPGNLNLLDQIEPFMGETASPYVNWLYAHIIKNGLPIFPGTLSAGYTTSNVRERLELELRRRPTTQQINNIQSSYSGVSSRAWENAEFPVWQQNPVEGMDNLPEWNPPMTGQGSSIDFTPSQTHDKPLIWLVPFPPVGWVCPICLNNGSSGITVKTVCNHQIHQLCLEGLLASTHTNKCPVCRTPLTPIRGNQPAGTMSWVVIDDSCPGENTLEIIEITYRVLPGITIISGQEVHYPGETRTAYLPNHKKGRKALRMLRKAFEQGLVLTVGYSQTRRANNVVTWNDIPHKTQKRARPENHGYPDPHYVDRLIEILKEYGIRDPDDI